MSILHPAKTASIGSSSCGGQRASWDRAASCHVQRVSDVEAKAKAIKAVEHKGDGLTREIYGQLNRIYVTSPDGEDIAVIASALDDVLDLVEAAAGLTALMLAIRR